MPPTDEPSDAIGLPRRREPAEWEAALELVVACYALTRGNPTAAGSTVATTIRRLARQVAAGVAAVRAPQPRGALEAALRDIRATLDALQRELDTLPIPGLRERGDLQRVRGSIAALVRMLRGLRSRRRLEREADRDRRRRG